MMTALAKRAPVPESCCHSTSSEAMAEKAWGLLGMRGSCDRGSSKDECARGGRGKKSYYQQ
jgi:hypothetical protein